MPTIYLVRHGQKRSLAGDPGLTDTGVLQAQATGRYLQQFPITHIVSSPLQRAVDTAAHIAETLQLPFSTHQALAERMNWTGGPVTFAEFISEWVKATDNRTYVPKYGSSSQDTGEKIEELVAELAEHQQPHVVLVSHGGAIMDYVRNLVGDEAVAQLKTKYPTGFDYRMVNCAITKISHHQQPTLELLNFSGHLSQVSE